MCTVLNEIKLYIYSIYLLNYIPNKMCLIIAYFFFSYYLVKFIFFFFGTRTYFKKLDFKFWHLTQKRFATPDLNSYLCFRPISLHEHVYPVVLKYEYYIQQNHSLISGIKRTFPPWSIIYRNLFHEYMKRL